MYSLARRSIRTITLFAAAAIFLAAAPPKRPLTHKDYDAWRSIASPSVSRSGEWLAYSYMPQEGDGDLVIKNLKTGKESRYAVGMLPPPPIPDPTSTEEPPARGIRVLFTSDNQWLVATTYPAKADTDKARKERKPAAEMPKTGLLIVKLSTGEATRVDRVKSMQVPSKGGAWVAYLKEDKPGQAEPAKPADAKPGDDDAEDQARRVAGGAGGSSSSQQYGTDLVLRDLTKTENAETAYENVLDYSFARDGKTLVYTAGSRKPEDNGVYAVTPGAGSSTLLSGKGKYTKLTWDREQSQVAFFSDKDDAASKTPKFKIYHWDRKSPQAVELISDSTPGFPSGMTVGEKGSLQFTRDGRKLLVPAARPAKSPAAADASAASDDKVLLDLWHYLDDHIQPMQQIRANQERNRTFRGLLDLASKKYVQLATPEMATAVTDDTGSRAYGTDDRPYRRMVDYEGASSDIYLVDASTGARRKVIEKQRGGFGAGLQGSPDGRYALLHRDKHWQVLDSSTGTLRNLTAGLPVTFYNEEDDHPDIPPSYGGAGWTSDSKSVLVYDRYDVWQLFADGSAARNLTESAGRKQKTQFRVARIEAQDEDDDSRYIDPSKPLYLRAESQETYETGFYSDSLTGSAEPKRLLWGAKAYRFATRAREADVLILTAEKFDEFPDLHATDSSFKSLRKVSAGGEQMNMLLWGTAELIHFRNADGVPLKAVLHKPEGFDPKKKYPLMVYIYERMSQTLNSFQAPSPGTSVNTAYYVSNGYLMLKPDIVYTIGQPGQSALKAVLPAIQEVVDLGYVDENAIGIQGHSWGGYQIAHMITQTTRFKAAEAGAPVGNMTSAYSGIRWGTGLPRQFQYERTQSRIGSPLYEAPHKYLENSPVFHVNRIKTPLLMIHNDRDDAVPWYQGIELFLALRRNAREVYMFNYNGEFHGLRRRHNQKDWTVRMQQFFDHHLKGAPKPAWMEKGVPYVEREEEKTDFQKIYAPALQ
jgi:dipeptidyl aminopeptidase/acylaminoacyl peptidase